ncbi:MULTISPECIES: MFS transporter [unclassified Brevundimonas]|uniref:MFS transporter n=1 Tax=unclassified Brevundimonas TaxID=2622653 RepID=UPI0025B9FE5F|nr:MULTISPECIES: MFS transporter [unclassified Brevundimonas]
MSTDTSRQTLTLLALFMTVAIGAIGFGMAIPLLPSYARAFQIDAWQVGLIFAVFSIGQAIGEAVWGRLSDKLGRKPVLLMTLALGVVGYVGMAYAPTYVTCLIARLLCGVAAGSTGVVQALIIDMTPRDKLTGRLAIISACASIGFVVGPAVGGLLASPEDGLAGFRLCFLLSAGFSLASFLIIAGAVPHTKKVAADRQSLVDAPFRLSRAALCLILVGVGVMAAFAGVESVFGLWTERLFQWSPRELGLAFAMAGCAGAGVQMLVTARAVRRFGDRKVLVFGLCMTALALLGQSAPLSGGMMTGLIALASLGLALSMPTAASLLSKEAAPGQAGRLMGANMAAAAASRILGPIIAGALYAFVAPQVPFLLGAGLVLVSVVLALGIDRARSVGTVTG